jgi:hypothetical protein
MKDMVKRICLIVIISVLSATTYVSYRDKKDFEQYTNSEKQIVTRCLQAAKKTQDIIKASESCAIMMENFSAVMHGIDTVNGDANITPSQADSINKFFIKRIMELK